MDFTSQITADTDVHWLAVPHCCCHSGIQETVRILQMHYLGLQSECQVLLRWHLMKCTVSDACANSHGIVVQQHKCDGPMHASA